MNCRAYLLGIIVLLCVLVAQASGEAIGVVVAGAQLDSCCVVFRGVEVIDLQLIVAGHDETVPISGWDAQLEVEGSIVVTEVGILGMNVDSFPRYQCGLSAELVGATEIVLAEYQCVVLGEGAIYLRGLVDGECPRFPRYYSGLSEVLLSSGYGGGDQPVFVVGDGQHCPEQRYATGSSGGGVDDGSLSVGGLKSLYR